ncbi:hypothetical protein HWV62_22084 [Athelia sp. TMB]|nr:hypothetical protein HWV62_36231 [Athelia sp. TMB]KAF7971093.1 hypothetical protein HWV62_22084 [Athelia sp. TMB]
MYTKQAANMSTEETNQPKKRRIGPRLDAHLELGGSCTVTNTDTGGKLAGSSLYETKKNKNSAREPHTRSLSKLAQPTRIALRKSRSKLAAKQLHIELAQSSMSSISTSWNKENNHPIFEPVALHVSASNIEESQISPGMQYFSTSSNQHAYLHASPFISNPSVQCQTQQTSTSLKIHTPQPKTPIRLEHLGLLVDALKEESYFDAIAVVPSTVEEKTYFHSQNVTGVHRDDSVSVGNTTWILKPNPVESKSCPDHLLLQTSTMTYREDQMESAPFPCSWLGSSYNPADPLLVISSSYDQDHHSGEFCP